MKLLWNIFCRTLVLSILISPWLLLASAERVEFCDSIPENLVDWNASAILPKFDPEMGTLKKVELSCTMNLSQEIMLENRNSKPANFTLSLFGELSAELPSSENMSIGVKYSKEGNLSGYDGALDYEGASGIKSASKIPTEAASKSISNLDDFLAGTPGENITIPVKVNIASMNRMPGTSSLLVVTNAGAVVCVSYTYDGKSVEDGGEQQ